MNRLLAALALLPVTVVTAGCARPIPTTPSGFVGNPPVSLPSSSPPSPSPAPPPAFPNTSGNGPDRLFGTPIALGTPVSGTLHKSDPACFRQWDSSAVCRQYDFDAPAAGTLSATLRWPGPPAPLSDPDVFLVEPGGGWEVAREAWPAKEVSLRVNQGSTYRVIVMAYPPYELDFKLVVEMR